MYAKGEGREVSAQRMEFEKDDKVTGPKELARFVTFADALGVPVSASDLPERRGSLVGRLISDDDNTKVKVDMLFTDDGLDAIAGSGRQKALEAMKWSHAQFNTDLIDVPVHDARAQAIAGQYVNAKAQMRGKEGRPKEQLQAKARRLGRQYKKLTGRKMHKDFDMWKDAAQFASHVGKMGAQPEAGWTGLFADLGDDKRFDYMHAMLALQHLASPEQTLVNELSIEGEGVDIRAGDA